jgi:hypothetical protein
MDFWYFAYGSNVFRLRFKHGFEFHCEPRVSGRVSRNAPFCVVGGCGSTSCRADAEWL